MAEPSTTDYLFDLVQVTVVGLAMTVTMIVFACVEKGLSTRILGFGFGGIFGIFTLFMAASAAKVRKSG